MARDVDDVVDASRDPVVAFLVSNAAIAAEVAAWELGEVGVEEALWITIDSAHLTWPRSFDAKITFAFPVKLIIILVHDNRHNPKERLCRTSRLKRRHPWQRGYHNPACLRLPPGVNYLTLPASNDVIEPAPRLRCDWLSDRSQNA